MVNQCKLGILEFVRIMGAKKNNNLNNNSSSSSWIKAFEA